MLLVEFRDVSYEVGGRQILSDVNFTVEAGETLVLLGRSGSGKTTALKMTNGMLFPTRGEVRVEGKSTREWDPIRVTRRIGCDPGSGFVSAFHSGAECRTGSHA